MLQGGSTGYGRQYRNRLRDNWGVVDVHDVCNGNLDCRPDNHGSFQILRFSSPDVLLSGAKHLVQKGLVDGDRLSIMGGSAGGYTTLAVLTFTDVFHVGASYFGVGSA